MIRVRLRCLSMMLRTFTCVVGRTMGRPQQRPSHGINQDSLRHIVFSDLAVNVTALEPHGHAIVLPGPSPVYNLV